MPQVEQAVQAADRSGYNRAQRGVRPPTQMGTTPDHKLAHGEVGKVGVAIDSVDDMQVSSTGSCSTRSSRR